MPGYDPFAEVKVYRDLTPEIRFLWNTFAKDAIYTPYQDMRWYEAWLATVGATVGEKPFIVVVFDSRGAPTLIVPLVLVRYGLITVARFPGGKHTNYNFPLVQCGVDITSHPLQRLWDRFLIVGSELDLYYFDSLPTRWAGKQNPLLKRPYYRHPATSSVVDLISSGTVRPLTFRHRSSFRKLQKFGLTLKRAHRSIEINTVLREFFAQKADWFKSRRIPDSFRQHGISDFFLRLFSQTGPGELYSLNLHNEILAVAGLVVSQDRVSLMFISYNAKHKLTKAGLGTHLVRLLIEHMDQRGIVQFDFGLGDAEYKRLLGAKTEFIFASVIAVSCKGRLVAPILIFAQALKRYLKQLQFFHVLQRLARSLYII